MEKKDEVYNFIPYIKTVQEGHLDGLSVGHLTLDFGSGHDFMVHGIKP